MVLGPRTDYRQAFINRVFTRQVDFSSVQVAGLLLENAVFEKGLVLRDADVSMIDLSRARVGASVEITLKKIDGSIRLVDATVTGPVTINVETGKVDLALTGAALDSFTCIASRIGADSGFAAIRCHGHFLVRGRIEQQSFDPRPPAFSFAGSRFDGDVVFRDSEWRGGPDFTATTFSPDSRVDLTDTIMSSFRLDDLEAPPRAIVLDGARIDQSATIATRSACRPLALVALDRCPRFRNGATLRNVDLSQCRLVDNEPSSLTLSEVIWAKRAGRAVLCDEVAWRRGEAISERRLLEAIQYFKEAHKTAGNHVTSGHFHYSEMEVKRRALSWPRRIFGWEALYWALSGYGTSPLRTLTWFVATILVSATMYRFRDPGYFATFSQAVRFSLEAATLQRPSIPAGTSLSAISDFLRVLDGIAGGVLIALLALALRMRLKR